MASLSVKVQLYTYKDIDRALKAVLTVGDKTLETSIQKIEEKSGVIFDEELTFENITEGDDTLIIKLLTSKDEVFGEATVNLKDYVAPDKISVEVPITQNSVNKGTLTILLEWNKNKMPLSAALTNIFPNTVSQPTMYPAQQMLPPYGNQQQPYSSPKLGTLALKSFEDLRAIPMSHLVPIMVSLFAMMLGVLLAIYYTIVVIVMLVKQSTKEAPLNNETIEFQSITSLSFGGTGSFNYWYFVILPGVSLLGIIAYVIISLFVKTEIPIAKEVKGLVFILSISILLVLVIQLFSLFKIGSVIKVINKRLSEVNEFICSKVYKNLKFLSYLRGPKDSIVAVDNTMKAILSDPLVVPDLIPVEDLAKLIYSLSLFYNFQTIGLRNPGIYGAFSIFKPTLLLSGRCNPVDYMPRYGVFIEDISDNIIRIHIRQGISDGRPSDFEKAIALANEWIMNTNSIANTIYPDDAFLTFMVLLIVTIIIQALPIVIFKYSYGDPDKSAVTRIIQKIMTIAGFST